MILVKLRGGLGNQMFQYAAALRLALTHSTEVRIDSSWYRSENDATPRRYELDLLNITGTLATSFEVVGLNGVRRARPYEMPLALLRKVRPRYRFVAEQSLAFDQEILNLGDSVCLFGYWQSERYFQDVEPFVRKQFNFVSTLSPRSTETAARIAETEAVAVHVRRTDYVNDGRAAPLLGACSLDYYKKAIGLIQEVVPNPTYFVFSDDLAWARANLAFGAPVVFVGHNVGRRAHEDLRLMARCRHHVIANSSFSWWAAWLAERGGRVIAPSPWFGGSTAVANDIVPSRWTQVRA